MIFVKIQNLFGVDAKDRTSFFRRREFGFGRGRYPRPIPRFEVLLLLFDCGMNAGTIAGWKLYENLLGGRLYFLLTGMIEFNEPRGLIGFDRNFLYELS